LLALMDPMTANRRAVANRIGNVTGPGGVALSLEVLLHHLEEPMESLKVFGKIPFVPKDTAVFDPALARRNKRVSLLWTLVLRSERNVQPGFLEKLRIELEK